MHYGKNYLLDLELIMSRSPERQIELLFSGSRGILNEEKDIIDCIKIFLMSLSKIPSNKYHYLIQIIFRLMVLMTLKSDILT